MLVPLVERIEEEGPNSFLLLGTPSSGNLVNQPRSEHQLSSYDKTMGRKQASAVRRRLKQAVATQQVLLADKHHKRKLRAPNETTLSKKNAKKAKAKGAFSSGRHAGEADLIARYHTIQKELSRDGLHPADRKLLVAELQDLGGLPAYQRASLSGETTQAEFDSSAWVLSELCHRRSRLFRDVGINSTGTKSKVAPYHRRIQLLDVGAIVNHYPHKSSDESNNRNVNGKKRREQWTTAQAAFRDNLLDVTSIDLHSQDAAVREIDFFDFAGEYLAEASTSSGDGDDQATSDGKSMAAATAAIPLDSNSGRFDCIVLSLVLNFVGSAADRGRMLHLCAQLLRPGGLLLLVLPRACLQNSRYMKFSRLQTILRCVGLPPADFASDTSASGENDAHSTKRCSDYDSDNDDEDIGRPPQLPPSVSQADDIRKLFFFVYRRSDDKSDGKLPFRHFDKKLCRGGKKRNNFSVTI